jgi:hypothetical protein
VDDAQVSSCSGEGLLMEPIGSRLGLPNIP